MIHSSELQNLAEQDFLYICMYESFTFRYWMSLTEVSSGSPAVSINAKRVMNRFPCLLRIKYASSQHCRNLSIHKEHLLWSRGKTSGPDSRRSGLIQYRVIWTVLDLSHHSYLVPLKFFNPPPVSIIHCSANTDCHKTVCFSYHAVRDN